ncbi:MAG: glycogen/starch synthase, partial [Planctomycetia bacterium]
MKILMCASEAAPIAKTGGLADVVGALSSELVRLGHDVRIVLPLYGSIDRERWDMEPCITSLGVPVGFGEHWCSVRRSQLPIVGLPR